MQDKMRQLINIVEGSITERTVSFEELQKHFKTKYKIDLRDYNSRDGYYEKWCKKHGLKPTGNVKHQQDTFTKFVEADDGQAAEPKYFDFWHFLLKISDSIPWNEDNGRWKITPLPSADEAIKRAEKNLEIQARMIAMAKSEGLDHRRMALPSLGQEAADVLAKIENDFGKVTVLLKV